MGKPFPLEVCVCVFLTNACMSDFFFFFLITEEPSIAEAFGLSMGTQNLGCWLCPSQLILVIQGIQPVAGIEPRTAPLPHLPAFVLTNWALWRAMLAWVKNEINSFELLIWWCLSLFFVVYRVQVRLRQSIKTDPVRPEFHRAIVRWNDGSVNPG